MKTIINTLSAAALVLMLAAVPAAYAAPWDVEPACKVDPDTGIIRCN